MIHFVKKSCAKFYNPLLSTKVKNFLNENLIMSCNCKLYQRRLDKLQKKYAMLKKNHRKLLDLINCFGKSIEFQQTVKFGKRLVEKTQGHHRKLIGPTNRFGLRRKHLFCINNIPIGVTVLLTEAIEEFVKGEVKTGISDTLSTCSSIYPDLFNPGNSTNQERNDLKPQPDDRSIEMVNENGKVFETATESEREYYEGFMARPKIPRTPQV